MPIGELLEPTVGKQHPHQQVRKLQGLIVGGTELIRFSFHG
jgi:hypothetical protein